MLRTSTLSLKEQITKRVGSKFTYVSKKTLNIELGIFKLKIKERITNIMINK